MRGLRPLLLLYLAWHNIHNQNFNHRKVPVIDGADEQPADARQPEDLLHDNAARNDLRNDHAQEGDYRHHGILKNMPVHDALLAAALAVRRAHIIR